MRAPTVSALHHGAGHSVTIAVESDKVPALIPVIKAAGGMDIVVSSVRMLVQ